jgi:hypothetical protein
MFIFSKEEIFFLGGGVPSSFVFVQSPPYDGFNYWPKHVEVKVINK